MNSNETKSVCPSCGYPSYAGHASNCPAVSNAAKNKVAAQEPDWLKRNKQAEAVLHRESNTPDQSATKIPDWFINNQRAEQAAQNKRARPATEIPKEQYDNFYDKDFLFYG